MAGVNKVILLGHLGRDPEMRYMPDGTAVASFSMATSERYKGRDGETKERTEWHNVTLFGRQAEIAGEYLRKGSQAYIEGRLRTEKYTDKEGVEKTATKVIGDRLQIIGHRGDADSGGGNSHGSSAKPPAGNGGGGNAAPAPAEDFDDEIPFISQVDDIALAVQGRLLKRVRF